MKVRTGVTGGQYWAGEWPIGATVIGLAVAGVMWVVRRRRLPFDGAALASILTGTADAESPPQARHFSQGAI